MLAHSQPVDNTECFGRQWASSCSDKHGFGPAPSIIFFSACGGFAFDWDDDGFSYSNIVAKWSLSLSLSHEYHHAYSHQLTNGKDGIKHHLRGYRGGLLPCGSVMLFVSVFLCVVSLSSNDVIWSRRTQSATNCLNDLQWRAHVF
jgi:hypothetical protein